ncbi:MAG: hypothetical protein KBF72_01955 [Candidatus Syntrophosphaera sp.]|nr:hypothetical protein [Candidatus Syntrophosphaera sp.]
MCYHNEPYRHNDYCCGHEHDQSHFNSPHHHCCCHPHYHHSCEEEDYCSCEEPYSEHHKEHHHHHHGAPHFAHYYECCSQPSKEKLLKFKKHLERIIQKIDQQLAEEEESEN